MLSSEKRPNVVRLEKLRRVKVPAAEVQVHSECKSKSIWVALAKPELEFPVPLHGSPPSAFRTELTWQSTAPASLDELVERVGHDALLRPPAAVHDLVRPAVGLHLKHRHQVLARARVDRLRPGQRRPGTKRKDNLQ